MESLKERYVKLLASKIIVSIDDLTDNEIKLIDESFELFNEKLEDIQILKEEVKRLSIELANLKAMQDDSDNDYDN